MSRIEKKIRPKKTPIPTDVSSRRHVEQYYVANPLDLPCYNIDAVEFLNRINFDNGDSEVNEDNDIYESI